MKGINLPLFVLMLTLQAGLQTAGAQEASDPIELNPTEVERFIDRIIPEQLEVNRVAGATVSIVQGDQIIFLEGYGYADMEKRIEVDPDQTMFQVASVTKLFTWTAVMQLVETGQLDLEVDINAYLDFPIPTTYPEPITIRHLMTHSAGFEDRAYDMMASSPEDQLPLSQWLPTHIPARIFPPGTVIAYSNYGAALAGYIVERATGRPFEAYLEENVFAPLGMEHTSIRQGGHSAGITARGHTYYENVFYPKPPELDQAFPAGGLSTSAGDMTRFMMAHLQVTQPSILSDESIDRMHSQALGYDLRVNGMGLGFIQMDRNRQTVIGHDGDLFFSHSLMVLIPKYDLGLFVAYNSAEAGGLPQELFHEFMDAYYPFTPSPSRKEVDLDQFTGRYDWSRQNGTTPEKIESLFSEVTFIKTDEGTLKTKTPGSPLEMIPVDDRVFQDIHTGAMMVFLENDNGDIIYAAHSDWPDMVLIRQSWYKVDALHLGLLIASVSAFIIMIAGLIVRLVVRRSRHLPTHEHGVLWIAPMITGIGSVAIVATFITLFDNYLNLLYGNAPTFLLQAMSIAVAGGSIFAVVGTLLVWRGGFWSRREKVIYSAMAVVSVVFTGWLANWNLLWIQF